MVSFGSWFKASAGTNELRIICFQGYAEPQWVKPFEKKYNCKVKVSYGGTVAEIFTKAAAGGINYDVVSIDSGSIRRYFDAGLIQPIDVSKLDNIDKVAAYFRESGYNIINGKIFHIPMCWGYNVPVYNKGMVGKLPDTWGVLWDPKYKGKVSVTDEANNNVIMTALYLGFKDPYNLTEGQFKEVEKWLLRLKANCRTFTTGYDSEKITMAQGDTAISVSGYVSGLYLYLRDKCHMNVDIVIPYEGVYTWIDGWVILKKSPNPDLAHKWVNWMIGDYAQKELAKFIGFGAVNPAAKPVYDPDIVKKLHFDNIDAVKVPLNIMRNPENFRKRVELWNKVKATPTEE